jgi:hypothetical protein
MSGRFRGFLSVRSQQREHQGEEREGVFHISTGLVHSVKLKKLLFTPRHDFFSLDAGALMGFMRVQFSKSRRSPAGRISSPSSFMRVA